MGRSSALGSMRPFVLRSFRRMSGYGALQIHLAPKNGSMLAWCFLLLLALHLRCMAVRDAGFHIQKCCTDMSCLHICETRRGPCSVAWEELGAKLSALEAEFAFTIKTAIAPRPSKAYTEEDVWECVDSLSVAIEIAATRCDVIVFARCACGCHRMLRLGFRI